MRAFTERKQIRLSRSSYQQGHPFFVTISTYARRPWFALYNDLAESAVEVLQKVSLARSTRIYAWCVMPDHVHLLVQDYDIIHFVRLFKGSMTAKARSLEHGRRLWQRSFYDHAIRSDENLQDIAIYIWWNPVRTGLVDDPLEYKWSGSEVWSNWREFAGGDKPRPYTTTRRGA
jgi:putative transposase